MKTICATLLLAHLMLLAPTQAAPAEPSPKREDGRTSLQEYLEGCLNNFISLMSHGIPDLNIPAFDPWSSQDDFPYHVQDASISMKASGLASSVKSVGFSSIQIPRYTTGVGNNELYNMTYFVPSLNINGDYTCTGYYNFIKPIFGNGPFEMTLYNVTGYGTTTLINHGQLISLETIVSGPLAYQSMATSFTNLAGVAEHDRVKVNIILADQLYEEIQEVLREQFSEALTDYLNEQLKDYSQTNHGEQ